MSEPYLILHKVRDEPAFDIALRFDSIPDRYDDRGRVKPYMDLFDCIPDDDLFPWWIIPITGRRAYPYKHWALDNLADISDINCDGCHDRPCQMAEDLPLSLPDYHPRPKPALPDILTILGIKTRPIERRF